MCACVHGFAALISISGDSNSGGSQTTFWEILCVLCKSKNAAYPVHGPLIRTQSYLTCLVSVVRQWEATESSREQMRPGCATPTSTTWRPPEDWAGEMAADGSWQDGVTAAEVHNFFKTWDYGFGEYWVYIRPPPLLSCGHLDKYLGLSGP